MLGKAKKAVVEKENTTIIEGVGGWEGEKGRWGKSARRSRTPPPITTTEK